MAYRISPVLWPLLALSSPFLIPLLAAKNRRFKQNIQKSREENEKRIDRAKPMELPQLERFELTVLTEQKAEPGFLSAPGVSYLIKTDRGSLLFDVGFGPDMPALAENAGKLGFSIESLDALAISHLHLDHMGGLKAARKNEVVLPDKLGLPNGKPCFLPAEAKAAGFKTEVVENPRMLAAGIASTGPLTRSLFFLGWTEEQALVARIKDKGLVVLTGCGHPSIEVIIQMVKRLSDEPIYAAGGGLHFPLTDSRLRRPGLKVQMIFGTGKPPWQRLSDQDLTGAVDFLNSVAPKRVFLSAHDTCDHAIGRFRNELKSEIEVLKAGATYVLASRPAVFGFDGFTS